MSISTPLLDPFVSGELCRLTVQMLKNMDHDAFRDCWKNGSYLWSKFTGEFKLNAGDFICYLDPDNLTKLMMYVISQHEKSVGVG